mmetsp:Transcript_8866/g.16235  ORF Transcript_8866/g.16235 Transcript_8866/m.16235 type:complete len:287 (+) Transcript_8866:269-1129(+)
MVTPGRIHRAHIYLDPGSCIILCRHGPSLTQPSDVTLKDSIFDCNSIQPTCSQRTRPFGIGSDGRVRAIMTVQVPLFPEQNDNHIHETHFFFLGRTLFLGTLSSNDLIYVGTSPKRLIISIAQTPPAIGSWESDLGENLLLAWFVAILIQVLFWLQRCTQSYGTVLVENLFRIEHIGFTGSIVDKCPSASEWVWMSLVEGRGYGTNCVLKCISRQRERYVLGGGSQGRFFLSLRPRIVLEIVNHGIWMSCSTCPLYVGFCGSNGREADDKGAFGYIYTFLERCSSS